MEVDTYTLTGRDGDLFLICSDGLTSDDLRRRGGARSCARPSSLDEAAEALVRAANQSGGKDNITVVLFRLGEGGRRGATRPSGPCPGDEDTIAGTISADERAGRGREPRPRRRRRSPAAADAAADADGRPPAAPRSAAAAATRAAAPPPASRSGASRGRWSRLLLVAAVVGGLYALSRQVYFVGTNDGGLVTLYRGVPYELPLGIDLYEQEYASGVPARAIPAARRARVLDHEWRSRDDAVDLVRALERGRLDTGGARLMSARTRELFGLMPVSLLVAAGFAAVLATRTEDVSDATLTYGAVFLGLCVVAHLFIRARLPDADPYLFPLAAAARRRSGSC